MKINRLLIIGLLGYSFIALTGCEQGNIKNINARGKNIICFGDSITFGYGANKGEDYPTALAKMVDVPVINAGLDGDTSTEAFNRLDSEVLDRDPFLVIVEFCGNDFIKGIPKETTFKNIKKMIQHIQAGGSMVAVLDISAGLFLAEYRSALKRIAEENGAIFIPQILCGIVTNPSMKSDFLHPNAVGYKMISQQVYCTIEPYLKHNRALRISKE